MTLKNASKTKRHSDTTTKSTTTTTITAKNNPKPNNPTQYKHSTKHTERERERTRGITSPCVGTHATKWFTCLCFASSSLPRAEVFMTTIFDHCKLDGFGKLSSDQSVVVPSDCGTSIHITVCMSQCVCSMHAWLCVCASVRARARARARVCVCVCVCVCERERELRPQGCTSRYGWVYSYPQIWFLKVFVSEIRKGGIQTNKRNKTNKQTKKGSCSLRVLGSCLFKTHAFSC